MSDYDPLALEHCELSLKEAEAENAKLRAELQTEHHEYLKARQEVGDLRRKLRTADRGTAKV